MILIYLFCFPLLCLPFFFIFIFGGYMGQVDTVGEEKWIGVCTLRRGEN